MKYLILLLQGYRTVRQLSLLGFSVLFLLSLTVNAGMMQPKSHLALHYAVAHEVAPCSNGFDDVNVCKLNS
ncbi:hypothetical protein [Acinetobacter sp. GXMZU3951]